MLNLKASCTMFICNVRYLQCVKIAKTTLAPMILASLSVSTMTIPLRTAGMQGICNISRVIINRKECQPDPTLSINHFLDVYYFMSHENKQALLCGYLPRFWHKVCIGCYIPYSFFIMQTNFLCITGIRP